MWNCEMVFGAAPRPQRPESTSIRVRCDQPPPEEAERLQELPAPDHTRHPPSSDDHTTRNS